jgi:uncharacterized protein (TIGR02246 family)
MNPSSQIITFAFALLLPIAGMAEETVDRQAEAEKIRELSRQWVEAVKAGDIETIAGMYTEDGLIMPSGAPQAQGPEAAGAVWAGMMELPDFSLDFTPTTIEVAEAGDMAYDIGTYRLAFTSEDGPVEDVGKYVVVWVKESDEWKAAADIFNSDGAQD